MLHFCSSINKPTGSPTHKCALCIKQQNVLSLNFEEKLGLMLLFPSVRHLSKMMTMNQLNLSYFERNFNILADVCPSIPMNAVMIWQHK